MPNPTITGTTGNDTIRFASYGQPSTTNTYTLNLLAGTDTFDFVTGNSYASRFVSTNFTIGAADANGMITVTGASTGGRDSFVFKLTSVESLKFNDKTVTLSYGTPVTPVTPADTTPPTVSAYNPVQLATGVPVASNIVLTFSEAVKLGAGLIEVHSGSAAGALVATNTSELLTVSGNQLTINPNANLANNTDYYVTLASGSITDLANNPYSGTTTYHFTTVASGSVPADTTAPTLSSTTGPSGVAVSSDIVLTFSEAVQLGAGLIEVHSGSATGAVVATNTTELLTVSGTTLTINPTADLSAGTDYYVTLAQGSIQDLAGNSYTGTTAYHFLTASAAIVVPTTALPPDGSSYTSPALAGVGILGILSWVLF